MILVKELKIMSYFQPRKFNGIIIDFSHLDPFKMEVNSVKAKKKLTLEVKFTTHCFTESYSGKGADCDPHGYPIFHDGGKRLRILSLERYDLSLRYLVPMVEAVIGNNVFLTTSRRNWTFNKVIPLGEEFYCVFIEIRKTRLEKVISLGKVDLTMTVESAYKMPQPPVTLQKINFSNLCGKIYLNEKIK